MSGLFNGKAQLGNDHAFAPVYPGSPTTDQVPQRVQDIDKAKSLVGGSPVDVTLTTEQFLEIPEYAQFVKQMVAPAGINVKLDIQPQSQFYGTGANQPWLQVPFGITDWGARGTAGQTIDPAYLCRLGAEQDPVELGGLELGPLVRRGLRASSWRQFEGELDQQTRQSLPVQAAKIQQAEVPDVIAYWIKELRATRNNVHGLAVGPTFHLDASAMWLSS